MVKDWKKGNYYKGGMPLMSRYLGSTLILFYFGGSLLKLNIRKKGTLIVKGLLGNLDVVLRLQGFEVGFGCLVSGVNLQFKVLGLM